MEQRAGLHERTQGMFDDAAFVRDLGITLEKVEEGFCQSSLRLEPRHMQQNGVAHAGVQATLADHTAGGAGWTTLRPGKIVLSIEFKINLLRPACGPVLRCRSRVLRAGRTVIVAESEVYDCRDEGERLCSKATVTLAVTRPIEAR